jgi:hypothetical protein
MAAEAKVTARFIADLEAIRFPPMLAPPAADLIANGRALAKELAKGGKAKGTWPVHRRWFASLTLVDRFQATANTLREHLGLPGLKREYPESESYKSGTI